MKGDRIEIILSDGNGPFTMEAEKNGSSVQWQEDRKWVTVEQMSKADKVVRTMKFKTDIVTSVIETPSKPV
jgi:hypothetical protein